MWEEPEKKPELRGCVGEELAPDEAPAQAPCWSAILQSVCYLSYLHPGISGLLLLLEAQSPLSPAKDSGPLSTAQAGFPYTRAHLLGPSYTACPPVPSSSRPPVLLLLTPLTAHPAAKWAALEGVPHFILVTP